MDSPVKFTLDVLPELDEVELLWRGLDRTGTHSFFVSWAWIGALLRTMREPPRLLKAFCGGSLAGLALVTVRNGRWHRLVPVRRAYFNASGDSKLDGITIEHNGFALAAACGSSLWPAFISWFAGERFADELVAPGIAGDSASAQSLLVLEKRSPGYRASLRGLGADGIASGISSNARQQLRRSMRDYGEGLVLDRAPDEATALEYFAAMKELHIRSWTRRGRTHAFDTPLFEPFHRTVIANGVVGKSVDMLRIRAGGHAIGYLYNFRRNGLVSSYQSGFDDSNPALRPGYVCHALAMDHYAQSGEAVYDFLAGTNRLKQSFGTEVYALCWRNYRKPTLAFRVGDAARKVVAAVKRKG